MGFILAGVAMMLLYILSPFMILYSFIRLKWFKEINNHYFTLAVAVDQLGNVISAPFFNDIMITKDGHKFGNEDETISSVLGRNYQTHTLRFTGRLLRWALDKIQKDHCINSIGSRVAK